MGATDSRTVESTLEQQYKYIRKYYDHLYGEITVIQCKSTGKSYARIDKVMLNHGKKITEYLALRKGSKTHQLVDLCAFYSFDVDFCSQTQGYILITEYHHLTVYKEIMNRQYISQPFSTDELLQLYYSLASTALFLNRLKPKSLMSNHSFLYFSPDQVKVVDPIVSSKQDGEGSFNITTNYEDNDQKQIYISPESFYLLCRKEIYKAKEMSSNEPSIIFTLGMNFLECAMLVDLSDLYNKNGKVFNTNRLLEVNEEVLSIYGQDTYKLISSMTEHSPLERPSLKEVIEFLRFALKNRELRVPEYQGGQQLINASVMFK